MNLVPLLDWELEDLMALVSADWLVQETVGLKAWELEDSMALV
jgi:hypothetical protein